MNKKLNKAKRTIPTKQIFTTDSKGVAIKTADSFANFAARLGVNQSGQNALSFGTYILNLVTRNRIKLEAAYRGSWIVGAMIDCIADDMTRAGIDITLKEDGDDKVKKMKTAMSRLQIWQSVNSVIKWSRLYGGAIGLLDIEGQDYSTPLNPGTIKKGQFKGIIVYDRWQLTPDLTRLINSGPNMGLPMYYTITTNNNLADPVNTAIEGGVVLHHSRCIRMIGIELPFFQAITEMMWGESVLERVWDRLIPFDTATMSVANLVNRASMRGVKVDKLREVAAMGGEALDGMVAQFEVMREFQQNEGLTLIDKEDEFFHETYSFTGLDMVLIQFLQQISGAIETPLIRLMGQSPSGLGNTGDSDMRMYYDSILSKQEARLRNPFELIITVLYRSLFGQAKPDDLDFEFTPLWQMSATDKANVAKTNAETITGVFEAGLTDKGTALTELRAQSAETGMFGDITDEQIKEAESEEPPPVPGEESGNAPNPADPNDVEDPSGPDNAEEKAKSTFGKFKDWWVGK